MKDIILKPHQSLKTIWYVESIIFLSIIFIIPIISLLYFNQLLVVSIYIIFTLPWFIFAFWWIPIFFRTIRYTLKDDHIEINKGVWWQQNKTIPFSKITDVKAIQGPLQRYFKIGSLHLQTAGMGAQNTAEGRIIGLTKYKQKQQNLLTYIRKQYSKNDGSEEDEKKTIKSLSEPVLTNILKTLQNIEKELKKK
jgi:uncharacterized protein